MTAASYAEEPALDVRCDFCGKTQEQARSLGFGGLVAGKGSLPAGADPREHRAEAYICGECAGLAVEILGDRAAT